MISSKRQQTQQGTQSDLRKEASESSQEEEEEEEKGKCFHERKRNEAATASPYNNVRCGCDKWLRVHSSSKQQTSKERGEESAD